MGENNGFKVAFWVMSSVILLLVIGSYAYTNAFGCKIVDNIVCNDKQRQNDKAEVQTKLDAYNVVQNNKIDRIQSDITDLKVGMATLIEKFKK